MRLTWAAFVAYFAFALVILSTFAFAPFHPQKYQNFILAVPDVEVLPGDNVTLVGNITNTGIWTVRQVNLTLQDLPYKYILSPQHFDEVRILRDWNPDAGVFRLPYNFNITIFVPLNATGAHLINVLGQESGSWRQVSNTTQFILKVLAVPKISASEISAPATVTRFQSFVISLDLSNEGIAPAIVNVAATVPGDWQTTEGTKQVTIAGNSTQKVTFNVTPSSSPGTVSVKASYEFRGAVNTVTKSSAAIIPIAPKLPGEPTEKPTATGFASLLKFVQGLGPIVIGILILILIIIVWNLYKIAKVLTKKKKKAEETK